MQAPKIYLGTHIRRWLWTGEADFELCVSHNSLYQVNHLEPAVVNWFMDSGAYSELNKYGKWRISPLEYARSTARIDNAIGRMEWAAPMDMMCEPWILEKTGLTEYQHQIRTINNFLVLTEIWPELSDTDCPYMPVLQAAPGSYEGHLEHADMYADAGVNLADYPVVGVGSVCRMQSTNAIHRVARSLWPLNLPLHYFGVKTDGITKVWPPGNRSWSTDSMVWSYIARREPVLLPGCTGHINCANCIVWATEWREQFMRKIKEAGNGHVSR